MVASSRPGRPTWRQFFFSPTGRFTRAQYWGESFLTLGLIVAYFIPAAIWVPQKPEAWSLVQTIYIVVGVLLCCGAAVANCFALIKRFHDRDKSWPWMFIAFAPYIGGIWIFVECGCLRGTSGRNRYGPDPKNPEGDIVDVFGGPSPAPVLRSSSALPEPRFAPDFDPRADRSF